MMNYYKPGDFVKFRSMDAAITGIVHCVHDSYACIKRSDNATNGAGHDGAWAVDIKNILEILNPDPSMESPLSYFRDLNKTSDEKLLKKYGIEDPIGTPTAEGLKLSQEINYQKNREEIMKVVRDMDAKITTKETK